MKMFLSILEGFPNIHQYFPIKRELEKWPRQYTINLMYTIIGEDLEKLVQAKI